MKKRGDARNSYGSSTATLVVAAVAVADFFSFFMFFWERVFLFVRESYNVRVFVSVCVRAAFEFDCFVVPRSPPTMLSLVSFMVCFIMLFIVLLKFS